MERKIDRLDKYMAVKKLNDNKMAISTGLSNGVIGKSRNEGRDLSTATIDKIIKAHPDLNMVWLMTGEGEMLCREKEQPTCRTQEGETELSRISDSIRSIAETLERIERKLGK